VLDQAVEPVEIEIDDRGDVKRQQLRDQQSADDRDAKRLAQSEPAPVASAIGSSPAAERNW